MAWGGLFGFSICFGFSFCWGGREGVLNGDTVQNTGVRCETLVLKFVGRAAEPALELGLEKPRA